jgi:hypothetical protein
MQMDATSAFPNGMMKEEVYMKKREGFAIKRQELLVCKLKGSIWSEAAIEILELYSGRPCEENGICADN